jgi:hypothetical protein
VYALHDGTNRQAGGRQELTATCHNRIRAKAARTAGLVARVAASSPKPVDLGAAVMGALRS